MADEIKKVEAPVQGQVPEPKVEAKSQQKVEEPAKPTGLDGFTTEQLKALYSKSPQMFEEAGIVKKPEPKVEPKIEKPPEPQSAAPVVYEGKEIKLAEDVPVNKEAVAAYLAHAKEIGLSPEQAQKEIDFQVKQYRDSVAKEPKPKTPEVIRAEQDAANVAVLKADKAFSGAKGEKYGANMELARRAAVQYGDADLLERLKTSDPVLIRHFLKLGKANAEDTSEPGGAPRSGIEGEEVEKGRQAGLRARYRNTPQMFKDEPPTQ